MTKLNYKSTTEKPAIELLCEEIQDDLLMVLAVAGTVLQKTRNRVRDQKVAIVAEMGTENAQALLAVYTKLKEAIETGKGVTLEDLPSE